MTALSLSLALAIGAWILHGGVGDNGSGVVAARGMDSPNTAVQATGVTGKRAWPDAAPVSPAVAATPFVVYLAGSHEQATRMHTEGLIEAGMALIAGTLEERSRALATIKALELEMESNRPPRRLEIVDLRQR